VSLKNALKGFHQWKIKYIFNTLTLSDIILVYYIVLLCYFYFVAKHCESDFNQKELDWVHVSRI